MNVQIEVPDGESDAVRSGIYNFISKVEESGVKDEPFVSFTVTPTGSEFLYDFQFSDRAAALAFVNFLPSIFAGQVTLSHGLAAH